MASLVFDDYPYLTTEDTPGVHGESLKRKTRASRPLHNTCGLNSGESKRCNVSLHWEYVSLSHLTLTLEQAHHKSVELSSGIGGK